MGLSERARGQNKLSVFASKQLRISPTCPETIYLGRNLPRPHHQIVRGGSRGMSRALSRNTAEEEARQTGRRLSRNADCLGDGNSGLFGGRKLRIVWGVESGIVFMLASSRTTTQQAISIVPARGIRNCFDAHGTRLMQLVPRVPRGMRGVMRVMPARGGGRRQAGRRRSKGVAGPSRETHAESRAERREGGGRRQAGRRRSKESRLFWRAESGIVLMLTGPG
jgi:hypothetical protein